MQGRGRAEGLQVVGGAGIEAFILVIQLFIVVDVTVVVRFAGIIIIRLSSLKLLRSFPCGDCLLRVY